MGDDIVIDPQIRAWVVFPIVFIAFMFGVFRHYLATLIKNPKIPELISVTET
jgi:hypothetical protein